MEVTQVDVTHVRDTGGCYRTEAIVVVASFLTCSLLRLVELYFCILVVSEILIIKILKNIINY